MSAPSAGIPPRTASPRLLEVRMKPANAPPTLAAEQAAFHSIFPGVMVAMFLAAIDQTILAASIPAIVAALGGFADVSWLASAYLLAATVTAPFYGHLGDRFGRRRMLLVALGLFTAASVACALAQSLPQLIAARALQGLGGGGLMTLAQALISEHVPPRERGRFQGYFAAVFATSSTLGPLLGGYLTEHLSWRAIFAMNLPLGAVAAVLALRISQPAQAGSARFVADVPGAMLFSVSAVALLYALSSAGHRFDWTSPTLFALLGLAAVCAVALGWWERRAPDPVIPTRLLAQPAILRSNALVLAFGAALFGFILYLPFYLQLSRGVGIGDSGLLLLPVTLTLALASTTTGRLITKTGRLTIFPTVGLSISTVAFLALALGARDAPTAAVLALVLVAAAGLGTVMPVTQIVVQDTAGSDALGSATASVSVSRSFGGSLGAALLGAVLVALLGPATSAFQVGEGLTHSIAALTATERAAIAAQVGGAFAWVFGILAALTALGALLASIIPRKRI